MGLFDFFDCKREIATLRGHINDMLLANADMKAKLKELEKRADNIDADLSSAKKKRRLKDDPEHIDNPEDIDKELSPFEKLIVKEKL